MDFFPIFLFFCFFQIQTKKTIKFFSNLKMVFEQRTTKSSVCLRWHEVVNIQKSLEIVWRGVIQNTNLTTNGSTNFALCPDKLNHLLLSIPNIMVMSQLKNTFRKIYFDKIFLATLTILKNVDLIIKPYLRIPNSHFRYQNFSSRFCTPWYDRLASERSKRLLVDGCKIYTGLTSSQRPQPPTFRQDFRKPHSLDSISSTSKNDTINSKKTNQNFIFNNEGKIHKK